MSFFLLCLVATTKANVYLAETIDGIVKRYFPHMVKSFFSNTNISEMIRVKISTKTRVFTVSRRMTKHTRSLKPLYTIQAYTHASL